MDEQAERVTKAFFNQLCRHIVAIGGTYQQLDNEGNALTAPKLFTYSGFIMSFRGLWFLVTAGHVIKELEEYVKHKSIRIAELFLIDHFGSDENHHSSIPFDFEHLPHFWVDHEADGLDYGFIHITEHDRRLLEANGKVPIEEMNWLHQSHEDAYILCVLIGLP